MQNVQLFEFIVQVSQVSSQKSHDHVILFSNKIFKFLTLKVILPVFKYFLNLPNYDFKHYPKFTQL